MSIYPLKELGTFKNGANYPKGSYGEGIPIVNVKDLFTPRYVDLSKLVELKKGALKNEDDYIVLNDDILFSRSSLVQSGAGMCAIAHGITRKTLFCGFIIRYRIFRNDIVNPLYLLYLLRTPSYRRLFTGTQQTNIANINHDTLGDIEVDLPDINVQNSIVDVLKSIDDKRDNNITICSDLESMSKLLYDYWFVQFDFPDENGRPYKSSGGKMVWNEELKREIPEGWKVAPFEKCIASINTGLNPRDNFQLNTGGKIRYLTVKNLTKEGTIDFTSCDMIDEDARAIVHRRSDIQVGDILFASISPLGRCHVITETPEDWDINESVFSIRPNYQNMTSIFLYMTFMSDVFIKKAEGSSAGSVFKGIRISELQGLNTILPPKAILNAFDEQTKNIFKMKAIAFAENQQLAALRDFLLPMLMNGQVKVADKTSEE